MPQYFIKRLPIFLFFLIFGCSRNESDDKLFDIHYSFDVIGHRGASGIAPENTLDAFDYCLRSNIDAIETDVQLTKDNVPVLFHDGTLDRMTNGSGVLRNYTLEQLKKLNAGKPFGEKYPNARIATLEEAILQINGKKRFYIEIKDSRVKSKVVDVINKYNAAKWCIVTSFFDSDILGVAELDTTIQCGKIVSKRSEILDDNGILKIDKYIGIKEFLIDNSIITQSMIDQLHALNRKVYVWTVNDVKLGEKLKKMNVEGVLSDYPHNLLQLK